MKRLTPRAWLSLAVALAAAVVAAVAAVAGQGSDTSLYSAPDAPAAFAAPDATKGGEASGHQMQQGDGLWSKPPTGDSWAEYFGVTVEKTFDGRGPRLVNPKPGQVYFYTNSGTAWGATNTKNSVVIFDATNMKRWKHVATTNLPDEYSLGYSSHGANVSADGRWIYLQSMSNPGRPSRLLVIDGFTLKIVKVFRSGAGGFGGHHVNNFTGPDGHDYIMNVDFNWNFGGGGAWVIDPSRDHEIVGGISRRDISNPYVMSGDVGGPFMYATVPAAVAAQRGTVEGTLTKIDLTNWKVLGTAPVMDPIWVEPTQDGKIAWVTEGDESRVAKIDLATMKVLAHVRSGPGPWGARLSCDETQLFVADKGEAGGYNQNGRTITVIDTRYNGVTDSMNTGRTTDHLILSPGCKYVVGSSNADHTLSIYDVDTLELVQVVKVPNDGDVHAGTFVRWRSNGKGGVVGEVVSDITGLRGSARLAQQALIRTMQQAINVRINPRNRFAGTGASFAPDTVTVSAGQAATLFFSYVAGTSASPITIATTAAGIKPFKLAPGARKLLTFKAPAAPGTFTFTVKEDPKAKPLTVIVGEPAPPGPVREVVIEARGNAFDLKNLTVKVGEQVRFTIINQDDEKHNLVNAEAGLPKSEAPDVGGGRTVSFTWTAPNRPGTYKFICTYHPWMVINVTIQK